MYCLHYRLADLRVGRQPRCPQPVVADHAVLIGVRDRARLESCHRSEGLGEIFAQSVEVTVTEASEAEVQLYRWVVERCPQRRK